MWEQADIIDAACGGVDSIPEDEYYDYVAACLLALGEDFEHGREARRLGIDENS